MTRHTSDTSRPVPPLSTPTRPLPPVADRTGGPKAPNGLYTLGSWLGIVAFLWILFTDILPGAAIFGGLGALLTNLVFWLVVLLIVVVALAIALLRTRRNPSRSYYHD